MPNKLDYEGDPETHISLYFHGLHPPPPPHTHRREKRDPLLSAWLTLLNIVISSSICLPENASMFMTKQYFMKSIYHTCFIRVDGLLG